jgi:hypothetical protein
MLGGVVSRRRRAPSSAEEETIMSRVRRLTAMTATVAAVAIGATGCGAGGPGESTPPMVIIDADPDGAIVFDGREMAFRGVRRDGTEAWRAPADTNAPAPSGCLARCPDAVLSGSAASANSGSMPDPSPVFIVDGRWSPADVSGTKRDVLTAAGPADFVLSTGDGAGQWWLEVRFDAETVSRVPVGGFHTSWQESADRRRALAITTTDGGDHEARWFERRGAGWQPGEPGVPVAGTTSCVRPDGESAVLIGQRPAVLDRGGRQEPVTDLELAGTCALAGAGGIVADLSHKVGGPRSDVRVFDAGRSVTWRRSVTGEAVVTADPSSGRVAYTGPDGLREIDTRSGTELHSVAEVRAARYDRAGDLVVVYAGGEVSWYSG